MHTLKLGWKMVKFGDVVANANLVERNPEENGITRIVGLEHIDPENLHIHRWNNISEGTSFTRKFVPGQTLFGKRRAYQRKVAYAEFTGICSGDILTFEPKDRNILLPELLPFICQSDAFFSYALDTSAGSLSPRTSWAALKNFSFPLPPLEEQKRLAELLWAADEAVEKLEKVKEKLQRYIEAFIIEFCKYNWDRKKLGDVLTTIQYGSSQRISTSESATIPILRIPNISSDGTISFENIAFVDIDKKTIDKFLLKRGDILIIRTNGNPSYVGKSAIVRKIPKNCIYASYLIRITPNQSLLNPEYLNTILSSSLLQRSLRYEIRSSAGNYNLNTLGIKKQIIPIPPLYIQNKFIQDVDCIKRQILEINNTLLNLKNIILFITTNNLECCHV